LNDTQGARYYVFKQEAADSPHLNCGTVHAPDAELALLHARDVFVRRPDCISLWVVRAEDVSQVTSQGLADLEPEPGPGGERVYDVFTKSPGRGQHAWVGQVNARSPSQALRMAAETFSWEAGVWWVAPHAAITASSSDEDASWYEAAKDKPFRHQSYYRTESLIRKIKAGQADDPQEAD
jgi:ring-1,2-phenylacetyl-CoA epoxidase subunit PaaB